MSNVYTAIITTEITGDEDHMEPEEERLSVYDEDDSTSRPIAFSSREKLEHYTSNFLLRNIESLMRIYRECKITNVCLRTPGTTDKCICEIDMTYLDGDNHLQDIVITAYEEAIKLYA